MLNSIIGGEMSVLSFLLCIFTAMVLGLLAALVFAGRDRHSAAFRQSLALLPFLFVTYLVLEVIRIRFYRKFWEWVSS